MYLIDTSIFLEVLLDQERAEECKELLNKVLEGEVTAFVTSFSLHSIAIIMEKLKDLSSYQIFVETISEFKGIIFYSPSIPDEIDICKIAKEESLDFDDALQYHTAMKFGLRILSFDKHFDNKEIKRLEPRDVL